MNATTGIGSQSAAGESSKHRIPIRSRRIQQYCIEAPGGGHEPNRFFDVRRHLQVQVSNQTREFLHDCA
jgi:hypothetical protein